MAKKKKSGSNIQARSPWPLILIGIGLLLILAPLVFMANNPIPATQAPQPGNAVPLPDVERISLADAYAAWENGEAVFVDTRGKAFYDMGHIPGAVSLPEDELPGRLSELNPEDWIITYCT